MTLHFIFIGVQGYSLPQARGLFTSCLLFLGLVYSTLGDDLALLFRVIDREKDKDTKRVRPSFGCLARHCVAII